MIYQWIQTRFYTLRSRPNATLGDPLHQCCAALLLIAPCVKALLGLHTDHFRRFDSDAADASVH
jgi:hypothetical protein